MDRQLPDNDWLIDRAGDVVARARRAGADAAEALVRAQSTLGVAVRLGELEEVDSSESLDLSVRLFIGQRSASLSTADLSAASIDTLIDRAVAMARLAPESPWAGLAPQDRLMTGPLPSLDLDDGSSVPEATALRDTALAAEAAARDIAGVTNSDGVDAGWSVSAQGQATSHGFAAAVRGTAHSLSVSVIAGEGERMQRDHDWHSARHAGDLDSAGAIGRRAGERAVARLDPAPLASGRMPVLFSPRVAGSLIGHLLGAMAGTAIVQQRSFLIGREGAQLFPAGITIRDDPHVPRGLRSHVHDGEGLPTALSHPVERGVIGQWRCDSASARQLGGEPTGHASWGGGTTSGNLTLLPGSMTLAALMADVRDGVLVTELIGQGVDPVTGDYSRGASGFRIRDGVVAGPVSGFTIAGNLLEIFADLTAADDLDERLTTRVPTLRTDSLTIAGG